VIEVRRCVAVLGGGNVVPVGAPDRVDATLVGAFNRIALGLGIPPNGSFDPSWVIWSRDAGWSISSFDIAVGQSASSPGSVFATTSARVSSAEVEVTDGGSGFTQRVIQMGSTIAFIVNGTSLPVSANGDVNSREFSSELSLIETTAPSSDPAVGVGSSAPKPDSIEVDGDVEIRGGLRYMVPTSAVLTDSQGHSCVFVKSSRAGTLAVRVMVRPSSIGSVVIEGGIDSSSQLALDVQEIRKNERCP